MRSREARHSLTPVRTRVQAAPRTTCTADRPTLNRHAMRAYRVPGLYINLRHGQGGPSQLAGEKKTPVNRSRGDAVAGSRSVGRHLNIVDAGLATRRPISSTERRHGGVRGTQARERPIAVVQAGVSSSQHSAIDPSRKCESAPGQVHVVCGRVACPG